jgi:hypothetical protein
MTQEATAEDIARIKNVALEVRRLSLDIEPEDVLFALAVVTASHICQEFPRDRWGQIAVDQLRLTIKMINEYPIDRPTAYSQDP